MTVVFQITMNAPTHAYNINKEYVGSDENFPNPERGFYVPVDPLGDQAFTSLELSQMQEVRSQNMTLVRRVYLLSPFREQPISQFLLDMISTDCNVAREAGVKLIIRFTYNWEGGGPDATKERILSHIEQLKPVFEKNYDVIAFQEVGFIGHWGQWLDSSNNLVDNLTGAVNDSSRKIYFNLLSAFPKERMLALTNPKQKKQLLNDITPLTSSEAFSGSPKARTGSYNDAFLQGPGDGGYYNPDNIEGDKNFLSQDHLYVIQSGETVVDDEESEAFTNCDNALKDLKRMRWSTQNSFSVGYGDGHSVIKKWKEQGCYSEIERLLGYRFRLINSTILQKVKPGGIFSMKLQIANEGWASPYNPRALEVILRDVKTGNKYFLSIKDDPRLWTPGQTKEINIVGGIQKNMVPGIYQVLLNLPDPTSSLYNRPEYSIRLANKDVWERVTGYNYLLHNIVIDASVEGENYSGKEFFESR